MTKTPRLPDKVVMSEPRFVEFGHTRSEMDGTTTWRVSSIQSASRLGFIWYSRRRAESVFEPATGKILDANELHEIAARCEALTAEHVAR